MKFTLEGGSNINVIRSYSSEEFGLASAPFRSSCIVTADAPDRGWPPATLDELKVEHLEPIFELRPELVFARHRRSTALRPGRHPRRLRRAWHRHRSHGPRRRLPDASTSWSRKSAASPPCYF